MIFPWGDHRPDDPEGALWDIVVIGAGLGGGLLGAALAKSGLKTLFLERGPAVNPLPRGRRSIRTRRFLSEAELVSRGRWSKLVAARLGGRSRPVQIPLGNGPGGSSAIYAATLERFLREDFEGCGEGEVEPPPMPNRWPISYHDFLPYYRKAEEVLRVCGGRDPSDPDDDSALRTPPPLSERDEAIFRDFEKAGLRPFRVHLGIDYAPGCAECLGDLCPMDCKSEGASRGLKPALTQFGAKLLTDFEVERLDAEGDGVRQAIGRRQGRKMTIRGKVFVLAAGALATPLILMNSKSPEWPAGLGNANDLVGRGLMFHVGQAFVMRTSRARSAAGPGKGMSSRTFNTVDGKRLGGVQSFGGRVKVGQIANYIVDIIESKVPFRIHGARLGALALAMVAAPMFRDCTVFGTQTEDFAYRGNRVLPDPQSPSGFSVVYDAPKDLLERASLLRKRLKAHLRGRSMMFVSRVQLNFGHPAGTCRFGDSPLSSVLDPSGKVRGMGNLYVADASFMPSISASHPALTVAAHALRVADIVTRDWWPNLLPGSLDGAIARR
jgi:choline dehydrogenase-like flavoprotein